MNKWTLASLRAKAEQIEFIDPEGEAYRSVTNFFNAMAREELELIAHADIKWFSNMARNRLAA